jgi:hypothetical protein
MIENDWKHFENFVKSSLLIEVMRAIKTEVILQLTNNEDFQEYLREWVFTNVLDEDEDKIYNEILNNLEKGHKWNTPQDQEYYN